MSDNPSQVNTNAPQDSQPAGEPQHSPQAELIEALKSERADVEARLLRVSADYQNYVRRVQNETILAKQTQLFDVARAIIPALDQFSHALQVDLDKVSARSLLDGMQLVQKELLKALERFQIRRLDAEPGAEFDPHVHEAVMKQKVQGLASGQVAMQLQPGYMLGDKVIRPALVAVAE